MTQPKDDIEYKIGTILEADSNFSGIVRFTLGLRYEVPIDEYPLCEIFIFAEQDIGQETGTTIRQYAGNIRFSVLQADSLTDTATTKIKRVSSYNAVATFVSECVTLFNQSANTSLGGLTFSTPSGAVRYMQISPDVEYGDDERSENNYENFGVVPFVVTTQETRT